jgi:hypothetical protein
MSGWNAVRYLAAVFMVAVLLSTVLACAGVVTGAGRLETSEMNFTGFTKIEVTNAFEVELSRSDTYRGVSDGE